MNKNFCDTVITIPQTIGTCWFNALLMMFFYSQNSRKLLLRYNNFSDKNDELSIIFKTILFKSYIKTPLVFEYLIEKSPQYILDLLKFEKRTFEGKLLENFDYGYFIYDYIHTFIKHLKLEYLALTSFDSYDKKFYIDIFEFIKNFYDDGGDLYRDYSNFFDTNIKNQFIQKIKEKIKNEIPKYIIINLNRDEYAEQYLKENPDVIEDFLFDNNMIKNLHKLPNEIQYKGYTYILDSVHLSNYNNINKYVPDTHAICGITCKNKKYIYNGWTKYIKDPAILEKFKPNLLITCELMPFDWDIHKDNNFCINTKRCDLEGFLDYRDLCFSFDKGDRTLIYILKNDEYKSLNYNKSNSESKSKFLSKSEEIIKSKSKDKTIEKKFIDKKKKEIIKERKRMEKEEIKKIKKNIKELKKNIDKYNEYKKELNKLIIIDSEKIKKLLIEYKKYSK